MPKCPSCETDDVDSIVGMNVPGLYDGILYWICLPCDLAFPRDHGQPYRNIRSQIEAEKWNDHQKEKQSE